MTGETIHHGIVVAVKGFARSFQIVKVASPHGFRNVVVNDSVNCWPGKRNKVDENFGKQIFTNKYKWQFSTDRKERTPCCALSCQFFVFVNYGRFRFASFFVELIFKDRLRGLGNPFPLVLLVSLAWYAMAVSLKRFSPTQGPKLATWSSTRPKLIPNKSLPHKIQTSFDRYCLCCGAVCLIS